MLIVGAKGFAKEVLEIIHELNQLENLVFFDDVNNDMKGKLLEKFPILKTDRLLFPSAGFIPEKATIN